MVILHDGSDGDYYGAMGHKQILDRKAEKCKSNLSISRCDRKIFQRDVTLHKYLDGLEFQVQ